MDRHGNRSGKPVSISTILNGALTVLDADYVSAGEEWQVSERANLLVCNLTSLLGTRAVAFRFTAVGQGASFQMDDLYLDPWKSG